MILFINFNNHDMGASKILPISSNKTLPNNSYRIRPDFFLKLFCFVDGSRTVLHEKDINDFIFPYR